MLNYFVSPGVGEAAAAICGGEVGIELMEPVPEGAAILYCGAEVWSSYAIVRSKDEGAEKKELAGPRGEGAAAASGWNIFL